MTRKLTSRQLQAAETKERIFRTAIALFERKGFNEISVAEICQASGVSVGTFYHYFQTKNDVLTKIFRDIDDYFKEVVALEIEQLHSQQIRDDILHYFNRYAEYSADRGLDFVKQLYAVENNLFRVKGRYLQVYLADIIKKGQERGELISDMTPEEMVDYLYIAARGVVYHWALHDGNYDLCAYMHFYLDRLLIALEYRM
jgi:TetR/AcrR family transcriptional regulator, fatty acid metabolism regulator protein